MKMCPSYVGAFYPWFKIAKDNKLTKRLATVMISGKYLIVGRNFSCMSHKKNAVRCTTNLPRFEVAIFADEKRTPGWSGTVGSISFYDFIYTSR